MWTNSNFTMVWRKNLQHTAIAPSTFWLYWASGKLSLCCIFLGPVHILPTAGWEMLEDSSTTKGWVLDQPGKIMLRHPCSCCMFMQHFFLSRFPLQQLYSVIFVDSASLTWGFNTAWIYSIHYTLKRMLQFFTVHSTHSGLTFWKEFSSCWWLGQKYWHTPKISDTVFLK